jgi:hypothetical protein
LRIQAEAAEEVAQQLLLVIQIRRRHILNCAREVALLAVTDGYVLVELADIDPKIVAVLVCSTRQMNAEAVVFALLATAIDAATW